MSKSVDFALMHTIPFFESYDRAQKKLTLRNASFFPMEILDYAQDIEILDMSQGMLSSLPADFAQLQNLRIAFFSEQAFTEVPTILSKCTKLSMIAFKSCEISVWSEDALPDSIRWLILTDNQLKHVPASIGRLKRLQKCSLAGNQLSALPEQMKACQQLEFLRISANHFTEEPPAWIFELPHLAWYGDAGNSFSRSASDNGLSNTLPLTSWNELRCSEIIGESPSSIVYSGVVRATQERVAIKVYKGDLTSDGWPRDDMYASSAAGLHPHLMPMRGKLVDHPEGKQGLVMSLIPSSYTKLGLPPSFASCTRDTYRSDAQFSLDRCVRILSDIASASAHLHSRGIAHGDLYAHNIVSNAVGESYLGDFGAATCYDRSTSHAREQIDVCAFGHLIEELLSRCLDLDSQSSRVAQLSALHAQCIQSDVAKRPLFSDIFSRISLI